MNWIDFIVAGGVLAIATVILLRGIMKRRRGGNRPCTGCPYADACAKNEDCPMKTKPGKP
ncbi:MAG: hypothetical protein ACOYU3_10145 [Bacillota bacterium]